MAEFSLSWRPEDYLDIQWLKLPRFALSALRGFTGLAKGEAIEHLFDARLARMRVRRDPDPDHHHRLQHGPRQGRVLRIGADARGHHRPPGQGRDRPAAVHRVGLGTGPPLRGRGDHRELAGQSGDRGRAPLRPRVRSQPDAARRGSSPRTSAAGRRGRAACSRPAASSSRATTSNWPGGRGTSWGRS